MKPCFTLILALALCLLLTSSYSIRIPRDPNPVETQVNNINIGGVEGSKDSEDCSSTSSSGRLMERGVISRVAKEQPNHHWFPWIHEDYRGPKRHNPKHH